MAVVSPAKKRILIGDDDPGMRLALLIRLRANNYEVSCAGDGLAVVAEARKHRPDVILLDLGMPSGDGYTVLNMLQGETAEADIPVIVLSARDRASHEERSKKAGAFLFLQKPVETELLMNSISRALELSAALHTPGQD
jgi:two-component system KDP operon response regulator KdpE